MIKIKITRCCNTLIWYANKIGSTYKAKKVATGYVIDSAGYFFVHKLDAENLSAIQKPSTQNKSYNVLQLLGQSNLTAHQIHKQYCNEYVRVDFVLIENCIQYLRSIGKIKKLPEMLKNDNGRLNHIWELKR